MDEPEDGDRDASYYERLMGGPDDEDLEEVQITGSRILRRDLESTSPLVTVGQELDRRRVLDGELDHPAIRQLAPPLRHVGVGDDRQAHAYAGSNPAALSASARSS